MSSALHKFFADHADYFAVGVVDSIVHPDGKDIVLRISGTYVAEVFATNEEVADYLSERIATALVEDGIAITPWLAKAANAHLRRERKANQ